MDIGLRQEFGCKHIGNGCPIEFGFVGEGVTKTGDEVMSKKAPAEAGTETYWVARERIESDFLWAISTHKLYEDDSAYEGDVEWVRKAQAARIAWFADGEIFSRLLKSIVGDLHPEDGPVKIELTGRKV